ncbi:uncharacterized protein E5676_scaffold1212G00210 [Cucumis melo var. makuwa]|uniref:Asp_protease_2 domain-containing protein n=1 Tax=Cucumis melo var. makuwa TaxID=1194695 RepID=A0A5A7VEE8_CUCMM|nr:uncharacterized protein E6C27_scaffold638G00700 [Cucumis melo var. makuwa]TYK29259.1 uncharacterized protein E5676_scaffold1212G00210 [Cucumis melo var. makuwa]
MVDSGATHNFKIEAEVRRLRLRWEKDSGRMKALNSIALPIVGLVKQTMIMLGGWKGLVDFVVVKMDDFDVVLEMEFLLEHQEPPSTPILFGALGKLGETVPKDTLCVSEKYHGVMPKSWPKSLSMRRMTDHGIESSLEVKAPAKNAHRTTPPESKCIVRRKYPLPALTRQFDRPCGVKYFPKSDIRSRHCRVRTTKAEELETTCVTGHRAYEFPVVPFSLTGVKGGKCFSVRSQINVLGHVVECHQSGLLREEDTQ